MGQSGGTEVLSGTPHLKISDSLSLRSHQLSTASQMGEELHEFFSILPEIFAWLDFLHTVTTISVDMHKAALEFLEHTVFL